jgi:large subunit ribosomal protein L17
MRHRVNYNPLSRKASHRKALHKNMVASLFKYEKITTTKAKALAIRGTAEKIITRAKEDSLHNRRIASKIISQKDILNKLFTDIGPRFKQRPGGYTRILKVGQRQGDASEMAIIELVEKEDKSSEPKKTRKAKKAEVTPPEETQ